MNGKSRYTGVDTQLRFAFPRPRSFERDQFVIAACNRDAVEALDAWPAWAGRRLALIGPQGVGKTHLSRTWASRVGAYVIGDDGVVPASLPNGPLLLEDADRRGGDALLFHLIDRADLGDTLLLTARTPPRAWPAGLPDLRSRLNALPVTTIGEPDDAVLECVLIRLFRERDIRPEPDLLAYLVRRIERSAPAAEAIVAKLDFAADAAGRAVNRALAREILEDEDNTLDLFE